MTACTCLCNYIIQDNNSHLLGAFLSLAGFVKQEAILENLTWQEQQIAMQSEEWPLSKRQQEAEALSLKTART